MTSSKTRLSVYVMTGIILLLNIVGIFLKSAALASLSRLVSPILMIATLICAYISFKENTLFKSKWTWVAIPIAFTYALSAIAEIFTYDLSYSGEIFPFITAIIGAAGLSLMLLSLVESEFKFLLPIGIATIILESLIVTAYNAFVHKSFSFSGISFSRILYVLALAGLIVAFLNVIPKFNKIIRWVSVIIITLFSSANLFWVLYWIILAFLIVPAEKIKFNLSKIVALVCAVTAILSAVTLYSSHPFKFAKEYTSEIEQIESRIDSLEEMDADRYEDSIKMLKESLNRLCDEYLAEIFSALMQVVAMLLLIAFFALQAVCLFKGTYGKLAYISYAAMVAGSLILAFMTTSSRAFWDFDLLNYPIFNFLATPQLWSILTVASFTAILAKRSEKLVKFRVFAIITAVLMLLTAVSLKAFTSSLFTVQYALYFIAMVGIALVMVPLRFTEYNNIAKHIFLTFITCGIWQLIWIYHVTKNLNKTAAVAHRKPVIELLLCIFVPFYYIYWTMKSAECLEKYGEENGKSFKITVLCIALSFVMPFFPTVLIQDKINQIVGIPE